MTVLIGLSLFTKVALGAEVEVSPISSSGPVLVSTNTEEKIYYPLDAGGTLEYDTPGPAEVIVHVRTRLSDALNEVEPAILEVYGDGVYKVIDIVADEGPVQGGVIYDARGGVPSGADGATITVPSGGKVLTLKAPADGPDFLVRVMEPGEGEEPIASVTATTEQPDPADEEPETTDEEAPSAEVDTEADGDVTAEVEPAKEEEEPPFVPDPGTDETGGGSFFDRLGDMPRRGGPVVGLGVPARGSRAVLYLGLQGDLEVISNMVTASLGVGTYRIGVYEEYRINDPFAGVVDIEQQYATQVVPVTLGGRYDLPFELMYDIQLFAGAGAGMYVSIRSDDAEDNTTGMSAGTHIFGGFDVPVGPGAVSTNVSWNGARYDYGNTNAEGQDVRETLATVRVNSAYLLSF